jgi:hypothetical protein
MEWVHDNLTVVGIIKKKSLFDRYNAITRVKALTLESVTLKKFERELLEICPIITFTQKFC